MKTESKSSEQSQINPKETKLQKINSKNEEFVLKNVTILSYNNTSLILYSNALVLLCFFTFMFV